MKRIATVLALIFAAAAHGQVSNPWRYTIGSTVSQLPAAASATHQFWFIYDGSTSSDCTSGGGSTAVLCWSNGSTWTAASGGGGGGGVTSVSVTTANGVSGTVANPTTTPAITLTLGAITPTSVATGAFPPSCTGNSITCFGNQATANTSASGVCSIQDVGNVMDISCNASTPVPLTQTIASGTSALGTGAISSATCATVVTTTATGVATTDVMGWGFNGDPTAVTGYVPLTTGMLTIIAYPTSGNINFKVCNNTGSSITPGAITLNWKVTR